MVRTRNIIRSAAVALIVSGVTLGSVLPASAADTATGSKTCAYVQQYGATTQLSSKGSPTSTTAVTHYYSNGYTRTVFGTGAKSSSNPGVSSGSWSAPVGGPYTFHSYSSFCAAKAT
ncbi:MULTISPECIES: hypothetical protein [unclassified Microbacterium]|uniref:hypothetical protein n=1 Tax=unclassified Microbacterium TaxID=2609290 RepID=UPI001AC23327|nr:MULTISPECIES: hypothetical protein [unclassified Microbacterium]MBN9224266.1 hypothetical protein [Microbacterium sp.]